mgnify:CR=1 FL=1
MGDNKQYFLHKTAIVDENVSIGSGTKIWHFSHIQSHAHIGENIPVLTMIKESFPMFLSGSLFLLMSWVDILMLGHFNSQTDVGVYTIALKLNNRFINIFKKYIINL